MKQVFFLILITSFLLWYNKSNINAEKYIAIGIVAVIGVVGCVLIIKKEK